MSDIQDPETLFRKAIETYLGIGIDKNRILTKQLLKQAAELGHEDAINLLADLYLKRELYCDDFSEGVRLYEQGYSLGNARSIYHLAMCYAQGKGVKKDPIRAIELYQKAYESGCYEACFNLAMCNKKGIGTKKSLENAIIWFRRGMEKGDAHCACNLGFCYNKGEGVERNDDEARKIFLKYSDSNSEVQKNLGVIYYRGTSTTPSNLEKAIIWLTQSANNGNTSAMLYLGDIYKKDKGEIDVALEWYRKAAYIDKKKGAYYYGFHLYKYGNEANWDKAFFWIARAAENKNVPAEFLLGLFYKSGIGTVVNHAKALHWFITAAEDGYEQAYSHIGRYYRDGRIVKPNYEIALKWFEEAISSANSNIRSEALYDFGIMYLEGLGVRKNREKAIGFFLESRGLGCINATNKLKELDAQDVKTESKSELLRNANIVEFIQSKINDGADGKRWVPNILEKLHVYIKTAENEKIVKSLSDGRLKWLLNNKDFAQWVLMVSDDLKFYVETGNGVKKTRTYYPLQFANTFIDKKGKNFKSVDLRHNLSQINVGQKNEVRHIDTLMEVCKKAKASIKIKKL